MQGCKEAGEQGGRGTRAENGRIISYKLQVRLILKFW